MLQGPGTNPETVRRAGEHLRRGEGFTDEMLNYAKDGREYWIAVEVQPLRDEAGRLTNFMAIESDITERRAARQRLAIQFEVSAVLADADDERAAMERILQVIGEHLGWRLGQLWLPSGEAMACVGTWKAAGAQVDEFVAASRATRLARGQGMIGHVWQQGQPIWVPDISQDTVSCARRRRRAPGCALRSRFLSRCAARPGACSNSSAPSEGPFQSGL